MSPIDILDKRLTECRNVVAGYYEHLKDLATQTFETNLSIDNVKAEIVDLEKAIQTLNRK